MSTQSSRRPSSKHSDDNFELGTSTACDCCFAAHFLRPALLQAEATCSELTMSAACPMNTSPAPVKIGHIINNIWINTGL
jgi:hypothetical protein